MLVSSSNIITVQQLQAMLAHSKGAKIVTLTTITYPEVLKATPEAYRDIRKISRINGIVNFHYANAVNRQREKEGKSKDFVPKKRNWGTRLDGLPFVSHVTKDGQHRLYLELKVERVFETVYKTPDGTVVEEDVIKPFLKAKRSNADHQGVDKEVVLRDYPVDSIVTIDIGGETYILRRE